MPDSPVAYFLTFRTYGTLLHGDARGTVDRRHNKPGTPVLPFDERRWEAERAQMAGEPFALDAVRRKVVAQAIRGVIEHRAWALHALNVRTNHVHVAVTTDSQPEPVMTAFKGWATRRLRERGLVPLTGEVWSRHGSTRWVWNDQSLAEVIAYVRFAQGPWLEGCGAPKPEPTDVPQLSNPDVGLCADCRHVRRLDSDRGSTFWLCQAAAADPRLRKYPQLPVLRCFAFEPKSG